MAGDAGSGTLALLGGGAFVANDELDRRLLDDVGADRVVVLPTAEAFEEPGALVAAAMSWAERLDVEIEALMVMARRDAEDPGAAAVVSSARAVYLAGESSMHLRGALKGTAVLDAIAGVLAAGGLVAAAGPSATAMCDPMLDQRGGAFTLGLGLAAGVAVVTGTEAWSPERLHRARQLANTPFVELPTGAAALLRAGVWSLVGDAVVHGELPVE